MIKLSLCIPTYNRPEMTIEAFEKVYTDNRINEIVIVDDCSHEYNYSVMAEKCKDIISRNGINKIRLYRNEMNLGMSRNKCMAIGYAENDWCILFDSDNILDTDYLDAFYRDITNADGEIRLFEKDVNVIFCPDYAMPEFNYTKYSDRSNYPFGIYNSTNAPSAIKESEFNCLMNTCNYIVNKKIYLATYHYNPQHIASDTIWHNYNHLKSGGIFRIVQGMKYFHRVHSGSGFMDGLEYNMKKAEEVKKLIMQL
jgi:glycosyltransferase involved in cell wall biosynthesis